MMNLGIGSSEPGFVRGRPSFFTRCFIWFRSHVAMA